MDMYGYVWMGGCVSILSERLYVLMNMHIKPLAYFSITCFISLLADRLSPADGLGSTGQPLQRTRVCCYLFWLVWLDLHVVNHDPSPRNEALK